MGTPKQLSLQIDKMIRNSFASQTLMRTIGARLITVRTGAVEIMVPISNCNLQQHGFAHAGVTFSIGDSAAGYAALSILPEGHEVLTTEMKINLLAPGKGDHLLARGRVIKPGRRLVIVQADIFAIEDEVETHVALMTGTMMPMSTSGESSNIVRN